MASSSVVSSTASPMAGHPEDAFAPRGALLGEGHLDNLLVVGRRRRVMRPLARWPVHAGHCAGGGVEGEAQLFVREQDSSDVPFLLI